MQQIIDTHIHVWNFDKARYSWLDGDQSILNRTYHIEEIEKERNVMQVAKGVLVQAANNLQDTDWMLQVAKDTDWIAAVVGWLPLTDPVETHRLLEEIYNPNKYFKGVRHLIHDEADAKWLLQPTVLHSLELLAKKDISFDVVGVLPEHIETVLKVIEKVPDLRMVFDHLNNPPIRKKEKFGSWGALIKTAAQHPNMFVKISGLGTVAANGTDWTAEQLKPYVAFVTEHYGTNRCLCGGDWPVSLLAGSYADTWRKYRQLVTSLVNEGEQQQVFYSNAEAFYHLS